MILYIDENKKVYAWISNENLHGRKDEILSTNPHAVWVYEEINYPDETKQYEMYYRDGEIVYVEVVEPIEPEPTQLDRIEANTTALLGNESALDVLLGVE